MTAQPIHLDDLITHVMGRHPEGGALQHLSDAVETSTNLGQLADHLIGHFVDQARRSGASWTEIGEHMGVTKQAAQKRFVPKESDDLDFPAAGRLSRFTPRARSVVHNARAEATSRGHDQVGNGHLVLGLLSEPDGLAGRAIAALADPEVDVRSAIAATLGRDKRSPAAHVRFGRAAKKTVELALREAFRMGHNYIGTEHILLGLLRDERDSAAKVLIGAGVGRERAEEWVRAEIAAIQAPPNR